MFLLVLAISFLVAKTFTKNNFERFTDLEDVLVEPEEFVDMSEHSRDIFIIDDSVHSNDCSESVKNTIVAEVMKERKLPKSSNFFSILSGSWRNLSGKRLINLST